MDEFHYYADPERGVAWQVPLLTLPHTRFLLMSATLGDTSFFAEALTRLNGRETAVVSSRDRPVPLEFSYAETPLPQTLEELLAAGKGPVYVVHFTQADATENAQNFTSVNVCSRAEKEAIGHALEGFRFSSPFGPDLRKWLKHGIGLHHAGLLPKYRVLVEQLAQRGLLKVICGTDTLGVGINVPIRTVLFTRLCKFSGDRTGILSARDFHQIAGRAGRKGFDDVGWVVAQAPEHWIENQQLERKAAASGKKFVKRKPPERNFVNWDRNTFERLIVAPPERLSSRFQLSHGLLVNVLRRPTDGCAALRELVRDSHETPRAKTAHFRRGWQLFRGLRDLGIVEIVPPTLEGAKVRVNAALQEDFSMNHALSLYLHDTLPLMDPEAPDYALVVLTLVESILEDPDLILRRQLDRVKRQAIAEMKAEGLDFHQRLEELEKLEYPKPNREFVYSTFNAFAAQHPWVGNDNIRPKSIAREMFEDFRSFADYVKIYELQRAEGLLLRHLSSVYKTLRQTVPEAAKNESLREMEVYLSTMLRQVDSSLLEEWEKMRDPNWRPTAAGPEVRPPGAEEAAADITRDVAAFTALVRTRIFEALRALADGDPARMLEILPAAEPAEWTAARLGVALEAYEATHTRIRLDPEARNRRHTYVTVSEDRRRWRVEQILVDAEEANDWALTAEVDLAASRERGEPVLQFVRLAEVGQ
ncbi:MAG: DUF3516 domain-containing protein, partial [Verrucomicrobia bacterium]|nr:DUF3516 domain-containing protein [Verrucomicrobiota bacterium]